MLAHGDTSWTVECWVRSDRRNQLANIFAFAESASKLSYGFYMHDGSSNHPGDRVSLCILQPATVWAQNSATGNSARLIPHRWTHLALTRKGTNWRLYQNGEFIGHYTGAPAAAANIFIIGRHFVGEIAELRVWNVARSEDSIRARMYTYGTSQDSGLVIHYDMSTCVGHDGERLVNHSRRTGLDSIDAPLNGVYALDTLTSLPIYDAPFRPQVIIRAFPRPMQFFARNEHDSAQLLIQGCVTGGTPEARFDSAIVEIERNDTVIQTLRSALEYTKIYAPFRFTPSIHAELSQFSLRLLLKQGDSTWTIREVSDLVCGDAFLICGQSNSHPADTAIQDESPFLRTFGVQTANSNFDTYDAADTEWGLANAHGFGQYLSGKYLTGVWGYYLQQQLMQKYHLPICVINGGAGGSTIESNLRNDTDSTALETIYGRTLYRSLTCGLADKFKAIFWYQGESNTRTNYYANFKALYKSWQKDYPNAQRIYLFQVRPSRCGAGPTSALRDLQRTLADSLPNIRLMSTASAPGHDGCHFSAEGYNAIGAAILPMVEQDFYHGTDTVNIEPPAICTAAYTSALRNEIALVFKGRQLGLHIIGDTIKGAGKASMNEYFYHDGADAAITSVSISHDTVYLKLSELSKAQTLTYLPEQYFNGTSTAYEGPTIVNSRGIGALTFHKFPIQPFTQTMKESTASPAVTDILAFPNPFSMRTTIHFRLDSSPTSVRLRLFDERGQTVLTPSLSELRAVGDNTVECVLNLPQLSSVNRTLFLQVVTPESTRVLELIQEPTE